MMEEYMITGNNKADLLEEVKQNKEENKKNGKYQIVTIVNEPWARITTQGRNFLSLPFSDYFLKKYVIYSVDESFYIYSSGVYKKKSKKDIKALIEFELKKFDCLDIKSSWVLETLSRVESTRNLSQESFNLLFNQDKTIINVKNGIIKFDFATGDYKFLKHSSRIKSTIQLDINYDERNKKLDNWSNFLETSLNTEKERTFLTEIMGYCLINHLSNSGQNFYCFHGEGGNGKGTIFRLLNEILGINNVGSCKAKQLTDSDKQNQFFGFNFINKLILQVSETNYNFKDLSLIKQLSGGDFQQIEKKKENETLNFVFDGKLLISTNDKVKIYDTSKGIKRRIKFLVINNEIKKPLPGLDKMLKKEKDSIFLVLLEALKNLIKNDFQHTLPDSHFKIFDKYMEHSNNHLKFIRKHIVKGGSIPKAEIITLFNDTYGNIYRDKDKLYESFEKELENENISFQLKKFRSPSVFDKNNSKITMSYVGISYKDFKDDSKEDNIIQVNNINTDINFVKEFNGRSLEQLLNLKKQLDKAISSKQSKQINIFSKESKVNQGDTLSKIISSNVKEREEERNETIINGLTVILENEFQNNKDKAKNNEDSFKKYRFCLTGLILNPNKDFIDNYSEFVHKCNNQEYKELDEYGFKLHELLEDLEALEEKLKGGAIHV
jgi:P4 family phage/plasmid primase-like protien